MALILHKGKPFTPPTLHRHGFRPLVGEDEFPGEDALWGADVPDHDFHKFLIGEKGSPFWLDDPTVEVPPPPTATISVPVVPLVVPGAVPTTDSEAQAALLRAAAASGALDETQPTIPTGPAPGSEPGAGDPPPPPPVDLRAEAFAPYAALHSKAEIAIMAKANLQMDMDPDKSKMADMLEAVKAELANRIPPAELPQV